VVAHTGAGTVHVILDKAPGEQSIDITSGFGKAIVELPATFDGRFEIETAYTETRRATHIDSAWPLNHQPVTNWDAREGTPRRYVRARGAAGSGRGLVRIRIVNGDIAIKRR
ncbi:MAG TPA: hypothetical protein VN181_04185, partial [Thermoanaerobaculia bacterium]|nr:hypothetical protein [Thermoanaerobaculia bacterium]